MLAERAGFEPARDLRPLHDFQSCPFGHSGTSPRCVNLAGQGNRPSGVWHARHLAERVGFEPTVEEAPTTVFETAALNRSAISPYLLILAWAAGTDGRRLIIASLTLR